MPSWTNEELKAYRARLRDDPSFFVREALNNQQNRPRPPQHGAIDFAQGADGVWRIPQVWADGDTIYFGVDLAQPGSDFTAYTVWSRR